MNSSSSVSLIVTSVSTQAAARPSDSEAITGVLGREMMLQQLTASNTAAAVATGDAGGEDEFTGTLKPILLLY